MAIIKFEDIKKQTESEQLPDRIDTGKATITDSALIAKYKELEQKHKAGEKMTVKEQLQRGRLKKYGDKATGKNKLADIPNKASRDITLKQANSNPITPTNERFAQVIESVFNGSEFITACKENDIKPKDFLNWIERPENQKEKIKFYNARICLAEYYLHRRETLESDLLSGRIDSSTYSTLANDYKYLAGKLHPAAYGDKIQLDAQINKQNTVEIINGEKIKELNNLLNADIIDADFTENSNS